MGKRIRKGLGGEKTRAFIFFAVLLVLFFLPVILNVQTFFSAVPGLPLSSGPYEHASLRIPWNMDPSNYMLFEAAPTLFWMRELQKGTFAFWDPYQGNGMPVSASITSGMYTPLKFILFGLFPYFKTFDYYVLLRFLVAGFGTYLFLKKLKLSHRGALLGGAAYMFSGYFILWITQGSAIAADMMVPWILLAIEFLLETPRVSRAVFLGAMLAVMVLSGNPEAVVVISLFSLLYFLFRFARASNRARVFRAFCFSVLLAFIVSLPLLWDLALSFSQGINGHGEGIFVLAADLYSPLERFLRIFTLPVSPVLFFEAAQLGGLFKGDFVVPYIGTFIVLFVIAALSALQKTEYRMPLAFFTGTLLFFILLWGGVPPLIWIEKLPFFDKIIFHKYNSVFYFACAALAAAGFEAIRSENVDRKKFQRILGAAGIILGSLLLFSRMFRGFYTLSFAPVRLGKIVAELPALPGILRAPVSWLIDSPFLYAILVFGFSAFFVFLFLLLWKRKAYSLLFVALLAELFLYMPKLREGFGTFDPFREPPFVAYLKSRPDIASYRIFGVGRVLEPWAASAYGLQDVRTGAALLLYTQAAYIEPFLKSGYIKGPFNSWWTGTADQINANNNYFLEPFRAGSVKYIISEEPLLPDAPFALIYDQEVKIYENADALPLAYLTTDEGTISDVHIVKHEPNRVMLSVRSTEGGTLTFGENYYTGWRAFVDGEEEEIFLANGMFRGIRVGSGDHEVIFTYWPFSLDTLRATIAGIGEVL